MTPAERALCDRLIYDTACLEHAVEGLPPEANDAPVPAAGSDVPGLLVHLIQNHHALNWVLERPEVRGSAQTLCGNIPSARGLDPIGLFEEIAEARDMTIALLSAVEDDTRTLPAEAERRSRHYFHHGLQLVAAFPMLHLDPLLLAWTLRANVGEDEDARRLQSAIRASAAEQLRQAEESWEEA